MGEYKHQSGDEAAADTRLAEFLPLHRPFIGEEEIAEVVDTLRSGWLTLGPKTALFEEKFAGALGVDHAVAVSSCTAALHLILDALGVGPGDEVITSPYTFTSTIASILYTGAKVVLADTLADYPNIDPHEIERCLCERTRVILPIHIGGAPCDLDRISEIAETVGAAVVEDAAHALPAWYKGRRIGTIGRATAFSLYAGKNITTGEGGVVTTSDAVLAETIRKRRLHGMSRDAWRRYSAVGSWYYEVTERGFKYNMTDINAAIGLHQLDRLEGFHRRRVNLVGLYRELLEGVAGVIVPSPPPYGDSAWHLFAIGIDGSVVSCDRGQVIEELRADNIGTSVHFIPAHHHPHYQAVLGCKEADFPNASRLYGASLTLPLFPTMEEEDVRCVARSLVRIMQEHRR